MNDSISLLNTFSEGVGKASDTGGVVPRYATLLSAAVIADYSPRCVSIPVAIKQQKSTPQSGS